MGYGQVVVPSSPAVLLVSANTLRLSLIVANNGSSSIYLGDDSLVTTNTGLLLSSGLTLQEDSGGQRVYLGNYYAISADSTNRVCFWERNR